MVSVALGALYSGSYIIWFYVRVGFMIESTAPVARKPLHKRSITIEVFEREDGLWDVEAQLIDTKAYSFPRKRGGEHPAGAPVHNMLLCITIDNTYTIINAQAQYMAAPYIVCDAIASRYKQLIGLNLLRKFRYEVRALFAGSHGCTHMTELINVLPTAAIQGIASRTKPSISAAPATRPYHIGGCHAMRADGEVVREYYPQWYEDPSTAL